MDSDNNRPKSLPDGWVLCKSKSSPGRKYYFNKRTGKSSWTQPQADKQLKPAPSANNKTKNKIDRIFNQKNRKEEPNKTVKRKSDGCESGSLKKKQKQDVIPEKQNASTSRPIHPSPCKRPASEQSKSSPSKRTPTKEFHPKTTPSKSAKVTPTKNLAQSRLNQLRTRLSAEAQQETQANTSIDQSPKKLSPPSQNDTPKSKAELKSPVVTETKCSTAQSPSSDSLQSMPSPSQFFAANKIISSMKAQLQEEYCDKLKPKDTFADIEKGIYDQTAEYPYSKHPATPPQFTEASKLVSAINSKLTKGVKDGDIKVYKSASDRLEALCTRLSKDMNESREVTDIANEGSFLCKSTVNISSNEDMEVEEFRETSDPVQNVNKDIPESTQVDVGSNEQVVLVVDTNIFIHELDAIKTILNSHIKGYNEQPNLLVPWRVINELDRLKDNNNGNGAICKRAKAAMDYLYKSLPENNRIKGQSLRDANCHIYPCEIPDDEILNCCLQQAERKKSVILLSKDKNLCNKAAINNIKCIELGTLKARLVAARAPARADVAALAHAVANAHHLLAYILENEMRAKYNNLWQHVIFKAPPWTLLDVLDCLLKHWLAVFNEVFPRIQHLITEMKNTLSAIESKDQKNVTESEVVNFKELCLDVAKKCQIIPEYMELAKVTADRLSRRGGVGATRAGGGETDVVDAFERLWTVFSSYCAKLSTGVGVPHSLEDKLPGNDSVVVLVGKWQIFRGQVSALTNAIEGALRADTLTNEQLGALESAFKDSLALVGMDSATVYVDNLRQFCTKCRNMLQEAYTKFAQLTELLDVCKNNFVNN